MAQQKMTWKQATAEVAFAGVSSAVGIAAWNGLTYVADRLLDKIYDGADNAAATKEKKAVKPKKKARKKRA